MHRSLCLVLLLLVSSALAACGQSKYDILEKAESAETKQELKEALGSPDDVSKLGPLETWTYDASDGRVEFLITGDSVALKSTSDTKDDDE